MFFLLHRSSIDESLAMSTCVQLFLGLFPLSRDDMKSCDFRDWGVPHPYKI